MPTAITWPTTSATAERSVSSRVSVRGRPSERGTQRELQGAGAAGTEHPARRAHRLAEGRRRAGTRARPGMLLSRTSTLA